MSRKIGDVQPRSGYVLAGGGLLIVLGLLIASVIWVSDDSKQSLVQPNPPAPSATPTVATGSSPQPVTATAPAAAPPTETMSPPDVTAEDDGPCAEAPTAA